MYRKEAIVIRAAVWNSGGAQVPAEETGDGYKPSEDEIFMNSVLLGSKMIGGSLEKRVHFWVQLGDFATRVLVDEVVPDDIRNHSGIRVLDA